MGGIIALKPPATMNGLIVSRWFSRHLDVHLIKIMYVCLRNNQTK